MRAAGGVVMAIGAVLGVLAAIGAVRFPSPLARMHAATKASSLGFILVTAGAALAAGSADLLGIAVLVGAFQFLTAPISGHLLGRAAVLAGQSGSLAVDHLSERVIESPPLPPIAPVFSPIRVVGASALWMLFWRDASAGTFAAGLVVGLAVEAVGRRRAVVRVHPLRAARFIGFYVVQLFRANLQVAWEVATPWHDDIHEAIVRCPLRTRSVSPSILLANAVTFSPGTLTVELALEPEPVIYVHVLQFRTEEHTRREIAALEDRVLAAFGMPPGSPGDLSIGGNDLDGKPGTE